MSETWIPLARAAQLLGMTRSGAQKAIERGVFPARREGVSTGRGIQTGWVVALSEIERRIAGQTTAAPAKPAPVAAPEAVPLPTMDTCSERQRAEAARRLGILERWDAISRDQGLSDTAALGELLRSLPPAERPGRRTIYRWRQSHADGGINALIPIAAGGRPEEIPDWVKRKAAQLFLREARTSISALYRYHIEPEARREGLPLPSYSSVRRYLQSIPRAAQIRCREGEKALDDRVTPSIRRDRTNMHSMDVIVSDHHQLDVACQFLVDGEWRVCFPWLTTWYDDCASMPLSWVLRPEAPNSQTISHTLRQAILTYGLPKAVHIDNGKDYRAKIFRGEHGRFKLEEKAIENDVDRSMIGGIYESLGIRVMYALPYNAKSKSIERWHQTIRREFSSEMRGYRGKNILEKPAQLAKSIKMGNLLTLDELTGRLSNWMRHYSEVRPHRGLEEEFGISTPMGVFQARQTERRMVNEEALVLLCTDYPKPIKVTRNGLWFKMFGDYYWNPTVCAEHQGEYVTARYSSDDPSKLYIFDAQGRYIGLAEKRHHGTWNMDEEGYRKASRCKKDVHVSVRPWVDLRNTMDDDQREREYQENIRIVADPPALTAPERQVAIPLAGILEQEKQLKAQREKLNEGARAFAQTLVPPTSKQAEIERMTEEFLRKNLNLNRRFS